MTIEPLQWLLLIYGSCGAALVVIFRKFYMPPEKKPCRKHYFTTENFKVCEACGFEGKFHAKDHD